MKTIFTKFVALVLLSGSAWLAHAEPIFFASSSIELISYSVTNLEDPGSPDYDEFWEDYIEYFGDSLIVEEDSFATASGSAYTDGAPELFPDEPVGTNDPFDGTFATEWRVETGGEVNDSPDFEFAEGYRIDEGTVEVYNGSFNDILVEMSFSWETIASIFLTEEDDQLASAYTSLIVDCFLCVDEELFFDLPLDIFEIVLGGPFDGYGQIDFVDGGFLDLAFILPSLESEILFIDLEVDGFASRAPLETEVPEPATGALLLSGLLGLVFLRRRNALVTR